MDGVTGTYTEVYYTLVEIVEYSSSKKYLSNFWAEYSRISAGKFPVIYANFFRNF